MAPPFSRSRVTHRGFAQRVLSHTGGPLLRSARREDSEAWAALRAALWPSRSTASIRTDIERWFWSGDRDSHCIVAEEQGELLGFIELSVRPCATAGEGDTRIGYVEGWYVAPDTRRDHIGRDLMRAGEAWAAARGCREFASDVTTDNALAQAAHLGVGFAEVARIVCYRKPITHALGTWLLGSTAPREREVDDVQPRQEPVHDGPEDGLVRVP
ncbi:MAG: GNAT family N-acetyltransferase [Gemmatimonadaceae bacterium]|nr:GNAT family N-acetyltransferase [Gemmatimonadaceae bacterium]